MKFLPSGKTIAKEVVLALVSTAVAIYFAPKISAYLKRKQDKT